MGDTGNVFRGCRAWWNSDDGWDFINATEACTVEYSWSWYNGYKPDAVGGGRLSRWRPGTATGSRGAATAIRRPACRWSRLSTSIRFDCAFYNKANGLYANHGIVSPYVYNNTSFDNGTDLDMLGPRRHHDHSVGILRNNVAYSSNGTGCSRT